MTTAVDVQFQAHIIADYEYFILNLVEPDKITVHVTDTTESLILTTESDYVFDEDEIPRALINRIVEEHTGEQTHMINDMGNGSYWCGDCVVYFYDEIPNMNRYTFSSVWLKHYKDGNNFLIISTMSALNLRILQECKQMHVLHWHVMTII